MNLKRKLSSGINWLGSRFDAKGAVLLYHRVDEKERDPFHLCVTSENFERQMAVLAESGCALSLDEFMERQANGTLETGSVAVTFDDGYLDVFQNALPILEKYGIPATVFVTTGNLGAPFWWDRLADLAHFAPHIPDTLTGIHGAEAPLSLQSLPRQEVFDRLYLLFRRLSPETREEMFFTVEEQFRYQAPSSGPRAASVEELTEAAKHPLMTLGAHTKTHSRLSALSYQEQVREIKSSVETLSQITGQAIRSVSYPFGLSGRDYNEETLRAAAASGLAFGFTADLNAVTPRTNPFEIPRLWVHDRSEKAFRRQLQFWLGPRLANLVSLPS